MITTVSTATALQTALAAARPGDTIQLAGGNYGALSITGRNFAQDVTITSVDASAPAVIKGLNLSNSSGLTFTGLTFDSTGAAAQTQPFIVSDSRDVHFANVSVHGSMDGNPQNDSAGLFFRRSSDVSVADSEFQQLSQGVQHMNSTGLTITNNSFHDIRIDGVMGGGSSNVVVSANSFRNFSPVSGDHPDAIQFFTNGTTVAAHDLTIVNNNIERGTGSKIQGIWLRDETGNLAFDKVTIDGNLVSGTSYHGIAVLHGTNINITHNIVQGFSDMKSWILEEDVTTAQITDNYANEIVDWGGSSDDVWARNATVGLASDGGAWARNLWNAITAADNQSIVGGSGADNLLGGKGADTLTDAGGSNTLRGDAGDDSVAGGVGYDDAAGGLGNDTLDGRAGDDWLRGADGNDKVLGGDGNDMVYGDLGTDTLDGGLGGDVLHGGAGNDVLLGQDGGDWLLGDAGNDTLTGGAGADTFVSYSGGGIDRITDFRSWEGDRVQLAPGSAYTALQVGADTVVMIGSGSQVVLAGVQLSTLPAGWLFAA